MKNISYLFTICLLVLLCSCNDSNDIPENDSSSDDISLRDNENYEHYDNSEIPLEIEITDEELADTKTKYCYWKITSINCPPGKKPNYKIGDLICYRCDGKTCLSDRGRSVTNISSRNFGGCIYGGTTVDDCADNHNCAGKYKPR